VLHNHPDQGVVHNPWKRGSEASDPRPSVCRMNYRTHISVPSSNRVEVSVTGHPELSRLIELPRDAPREWLAHAYLLSIGMEPDCRARATDTPVSECRESSGGDFEKIARRNRRDFQVRVGDERAGVIPAEKRHSSDRGTGPCHSLRFSFGAGAVSRGLARTDG